MKPTTNIQTVLSITAVPLLINLLITTGFAYKCYSLDGIKVNVNGQVERPRAKTPILLAIVAHPDDELLIGATLAHYADSGVKVYVAVATDGALGTTDFSKIPAGPQLVAVRRSEMMCSAKALGIEPPIFLNFPDQLDASKGGLSKSLDSLKEAILLLFTKLKPNAVITFGADGFTGHPDHRLVGIMVTEVFASRQWPGHPKLFYPALPSGTINDSSWAKYLTVDSSYLTIKVPLEATDYEKLRKAFNCHQSQYRESVRKKLPLFLEQAQKSTAMFRPFLQEGSFFTLLY